MTFERILRTAKEILDMDHIRLTRQNEFNLSEEMWVRLYRKVVAITCHKYNVDYSEFDNTWSVRNAYLNRNPADNVGCLRDECWRAWDAIVNFEDRRKGYTKMDLQAA